MSDLRNTPHFVRLGELPEIDAATPLRQVYAHLSAVGRSGFFLEEGGTVRAYVRAHDLATALFPVDDGDDAEKRKALTARSIGEVVRDHQEFSLPIDGYVSPETPLGPLQNRPDAVFMVKSPKAPPASSDSTARMALVLNGWLLNHESLVATSTRKTVWRCQNNHDNPDPDHGTCYSCPFPTTPVRA